MEERLRHERVMKHNRKGMNNIGAMINARNSQNGDYRINNLLKTELTFLHQIQYKPSFFTAQVH